MRWLFLVALAACYRPAYTDCEITCSGACPSGLTCQAGFCRVPGAPGACGVDPDATGGCTSCGGDCMDLETTAEHCGRCDHDCMGQPCSAGMCGIETIATDLVKPSQLAVRQGHYAYASAAFGDCGSTSVATLRQIDGTHVFDVAGCVEALALGPDMLYLADFARVRGYALAGTGAEAGSSTISSSYISGLTTDAALVYIAAHDPAYGVMTAPLTLGTVTPLYQQSPRKVIRVVRTASSVWYLTREDSVPVVRRLERVRVSTKSHFDVDETFCEIDRPCSIAQGGNQVFVSDGIAPGRLRAYDEDGVLVTEIVSASGGIRGLAADDVGVYWVVPMEGGAPGARIMARRHGSTVDEVVAEDPGGIGSITLDGPFAYWLSSSSAPDVRALRRVSK